MWYAWLEAQRGLMQSLSNWAMRGCDAWLSSAMPCMPVAAAGYDWLYRLVRPTPEPPRFGISAVTVGARLVPVVEQVVDSTPFCALRQFTRAPTAVAPTRDQNRTAPDARGTASLGWRRAGHCRYLSARSAAGDSRTASLAIAALAPCHGGDVERRERGGRRLAGYSALFASMDQCGSFERRLRCRGSLLSIADPLEGTAARGRRGVCVRWNRRVRFTLNRCPDKIRARPPNSAPLRTNGNRRSQNSLARFIRLATARY